MSQQSQPDPPGRRLTRVLRDGCGIMERETGRVMLIDGRPGSHDECGVVFLNRSWALVGNKIMSDRWVRDELKKALRGGGSFENDHGRSLWPGKYQRMTFEE
jgi:hypothetical protein